VCLCVEHYLKFGIHNLSSLVFGIVKFFKVVWMSFAFVASCWTYIFLTFCNFLNYESKRLKILSTKDAECYNAILACSSLWHPLHCRSVPKISWAHTSTQVASHTVRVQLTDYILLARSCENTCRSLCLVWYICGILFANAHSSYSKQRNKLGKCHHRCYSLTCSFCLRHGTSWLM
jgi:hypothetical protein